MHWMAPRVPLTTAVSGRYCQVSLHTYMYSVRAIQIHDEWIPSNGLAEVVVESSRRGCSRFTMEQWPNGSIHESMNQFHESSCSLGRSGYSGLLVSLPGWICLSSDLGCSSYRLLERAESRARSCRASPHRHAPSTGTTRLLRSSSTYLLLVLIGTV